MRFAHSLSHLSIPDAAKPREGSAKAGKDHLPQHTNIPWCDSAARTPGKSGQGCGVSDTPLCKGAANSSEQARIRRGFMIVGVRAGFVILAPGCSGKHGVAKHAGTRSSMLGDTRLRVGCW